MTNINASAELSPLLDDITAIDDMVNTYLSDYTNKPLKAMFQYILSYIVTDSDSGIWKDLPIYISSYAEYDKRNLYYVINRLREYLAFYKKILTDKGIQRRLVYDKEYDNESHSDSTNRGTNSETPQNSNLYDPTQTTADTLFDQAIANFASNINKDTAKSNADNSGSSSTVVSGATWEEAKKNIELLFFNELAKYIETIPERIYNYYSLETIPFAELTCMFIEYHKQMLEMLKQHE